MRHGILSAPRGLPGPAARVNPTVRPCDWLPGHFEWLHECAVHDDPDFCENGYSVALLPLGPPEGWAWDETADSVSPSLRCLSCGCHGWWRNGRWKDC